MESREIPIAATLPGTRRQGVDTVTRRRSIPRKKPVAIPRESTTSQETATGSSLGDETLTPKAETIVLPADTKSKSRSSKRVRGPEALEATDIGSSLGEQTVTPNTETTALPVETTTNGDPRIEQSGDGTPTSKSVKQKPSDTLTWDRKLFENVALYAELEGTSAEKLFSELEHVRKIPDRAERMNHERELATKIGMINGITPEIAKQLGKRGFVPERLLGGGAMGDVWSGESIVLQEPIVIKTIKRGKGQTAPPEKWIARFRDEAHILSELHHPNVVGVRDADFAGDEGGWLAMEQINGHGLDAEIEVSHDSKTVTDVGSQIACGLAAMHKKGVVHRDIKPANILQDKDGRVVIADFGLGKMLSRQDRDKGLMIGSPRYMAPEVTRGEEATPAADVWSLGVTMYEYLTGKKPFGGETTTETIAYVRGRNPDHPSDIQPGVPKELGDLIMECLEKDEKQRPSSEEAFQSFERIRANLLKTQIKNSEKTKESYTKSTDEVSKEALTKTRSWIDRLRSLFT